MLFTFTLTRAFHYRKPRVFHSHVDTNYRVAKIESGKYVEAHDRITYTIEVTRKNLWQLKYDTLTTKKKFKY